MNKEQIKQMMGMLYEVLKEPEFVENIADIYRNLYLKLIEKGFSEEQAFQIILNFGQTLKAK